MEQGHNGIRTGWRGAPGGSWTPPWAPHPAQPQLSGGSRAQGAWPGRPGSSRLHLPRLTGWTSSSTAAAPGIKGTAPPGKPPSTGAGTLQEGRCLWGCTPGHTLHPAQQQAAASESDMEAAIRAGYGHAAS